ncbi:MAG: radical SAM protein [Candidatus Aureabacteria bacterium]|nr:radical SAM protein [Candidatus Auribacterota bacterium]
MRLRKGIRNIVLLQLRGGNLRWLFRQAAKYLLVRASLSSRTGKAHTGPIAAHLFITSRCNLNCPMCLIPRRARGAEMDTLEASALIRELADIGTSGVCFTGGEPLLRDDIFQLISLCRSLKMPTVLVTNGLLLEKRLEELLAARPTTVNISIDGSRPDIHERSHVGEEVFSRMVRGARRLSEELRAGRSPGTSLTVSTVIRNDNCGDLDEIIRLSRGLGAKRIVFIPYHTNTGGWCGVAADPRMPPVSARLLRHPERDFIENSDAFLGALDGLFRGKGFPLRCTAGPTTVVVGPDCRVYPCKGYFEIEKPFADLRAERTCLRDVWFGERYRALRRETLACTMCAFPCNREFDPLFTRAPSPIADRGAAPLRAAAHVGTKR